MSRILVLGMGVPGTVPWRRHAGPGLRAAHLATALVRDGHEVRLLAVLDKGEAAPRADAVADDGPAVEFTTEAELFSPAMRARLGRYDADAIVGVTVYAASLAARLRLRAPLWADVFGDLMAEAQAKAAREAGDWSIVHFWSLLRVVLEEADRFSAVSVAQSHALVGQLGLAGRLSSRTAGEDLVHVIPCAAEARPEAHAAPGGRLEARRELGLADGDFVLLVSGGVNTWCDVETLCGGLALAMNVKPHLRLLVTGGSIPGHDEDSHAALLAGLDRIEKIDAARVQVLGWVDSARLASVYAACDLALHVERSLYERRLGAENRVVDWLAHGLPCVTTAGSETGGELVRERLALACRPGDAADLARVIVEAASAAGGPLLADSATRGRQWATAERGLLSTAAPLREWCVSPGHAGDRDGARLIRLGLLSHPDTSVEMLEAYVAALPVREIGRRGLRWLGRRAWAAGKRSRLPGFLRALLLWTAVAGTTLGGCQGQGPVAPPQRPNVLLVSIDTLRADHLGAYGYAATPSPSPWIDALAAGGRLYETAISSSPETAPALATLHTGLYQDRHGVLYNRAKMSEASTTLAERLKASGYATAAFVGNWLADREHGFAQGFDRFEVATGGPLSPSTTDDKLVALFGDFARQLPPRPWFAWVHLMDPHGPYDSAPPWWSSNFDYARAPLARDGEFPVSDSNFGLGVIPRYQKIEQEKRLSDYVRRYDGDIRYTDSQVGALLSMVRAAGGGEDTLVVLVADHGESLVEHDELLQHGWFVYDTTIRVPLVLAWPAGLAAGSREPRLACSVDIAPTILHLAGVEAEGGEFDGVSLVPAAGSGGAGAAGTAQDAAQDAAGSAAGRAALRDAGCFTIGPRANHPFSLRDGRHKLIVTPAGTPRDPGAPKGEVSTAPERVELYDLTTDPGETADLSADEPEVVEEMRRSVSMLRSRFRANGWRW
ncbi:MAG: sulfatase-like hydrolase/transferase [Candidatus Binatia bacterium]